MRMLEPHELLKAQFSDFAEGYHLGVPGTPKHAKVKMIGNSVCPHVAYALVKVNFKRQKIK